MIYFAFLKEKRGVVVLPQKMNIYLSCEGRGVLREVSTLYGCNSHPQLFKIS